MLTCINLYTSQTAVLVASAVAFAVAFAACAAFWAAFAEAFAASFVAFAVCSAVLIVALEVACAVFTPHSADLTAPFAVDFNEISAIRAVVLMVFLLC